MYKIQKLRIIRHLLSQELYTQKRLVKILSLALPEHPTSHNLNFLELRARF